MKKKWNQATIQQYIDDSIEESSTVEYKAADTLGANGWKPEMAKDVSAMANSAGGIIIYGVREYQEKEKEHLPERIDPIDRTQFSKETLENIITSNIQPRIEGLTIHPVSIDTEPTGVIYVVEIPQSTTAHQVTKRYKYYKRFNFKAEPMVDYEIRDVMSRAIIPDVQAKFKVLIYSSDHPPEEDTSLRLRTVIKNQGIKIVNHYKLELRITNVGIIWEGQIQVDPSYTIPNIAGKNVTCDYVPNSRNADQADILITYRSTEVLFPDEELNISSAVQWGYERHYPKDDLRIPWVEFAKGWYLEWVLYADNMPPRKGETPIYELEGF